MSTSTDVSRNARTYSPGLDAVRTYLYWCFWIAVAFFSIYPTTNWITAQRAWTFDLYAQGELGVPFVPQFIWVYLSMYVLFLVPLFAVHADRMPKLGKQLILGTIASGIIFLLLPAKLGFVRSIPMDSAYSGIYASMFEVDRPHNLVPSLHLVFSAAIVLACAEASPASYKIPLFVWLFAITLSTLLVHQHHVLDIVSAFLLVYFLRKYVR
jgi:membrane-associated phospholipid phosphatase